MHYIKNTIKCLMIFVLCSCNNISMKYEKYDEDSIQHILDSLTRIKSENDTVLINHVDSAFLKRY